MELAEQVINVRLQPPNQQANKMTAPVGQLTRIVNGIVEKFTREGIESLRIDKRKAFSPLTNLLRDPSTGINIATTGFPAAPTLFSSLSREAVVIADSRPHVLAEGGDYDNGNEWKQHQVITPTRAITTKNVYTDNLQAEKPDAARDSASGAICYAWRELHKCRAMMVDDDGTTLRLPFTVATDSATNVGDSNGIRHKVVASAGNFWIFYSDDGFTVKASVFSAKGQTLVTGAVITTVQSIESVGYSSWDVMASSIVAATDSAYWIGTTTTGAQIIRCTIAGGPIVIVEPHSIPSGAFLRGVTWLGNDSGDGLFHFAGIDGNILTAWRATTAYAINRTHVMTGALTTKQAVNIAGYVNSVGNEICYVGRIVGPTYTAPLDTITTYAVAEPDGTVISTGDMRATMPASRAFKFDGRWYYVAYYASIGTGAYSPTAVYLGQPTFFLVNAETHQYCGRWEYGSASMDWLTTNGAGDWQLTSPVVGLAMPKQSAPVHVALSYRAQNLNRLGPIDAASSTGFRERRVISTLGIRDYVFGAHGAAVEHLGELLIPGPEAVSFTGSNFTEHGIALAPEQPTLTLTPVGTPFLVQGQTYSYCIVAEATDNNGDRVFSQSTIPTVIAFNGANGVVLQAPYVRCTRRSNVHISIYRSAFINGQMTLEHFKITDDLNPILNDPEGSTWTFVDNVSDEQASLGEVLYTDNGFVQREPCPGFSHGCVYDDRVIVIGSDGALWFSGQKVEGEARWFNSDTHRIRLPTNDVPLRVENMDGRIVVFCDKSFWHLPEGGFPGPDGLNGNLRTPEKINITGGCTGVTQKIGAGVAYSSIADGVWLLTRGLENQQASSAIVDEFFVGEVASMCVDKNQRLYITMASSSSSGTTLVFDQISGVWSVFTHASAKCLLGTIIRDAYSFVTATLMFKQRSALYMDVATVGGASAWYSMSVTINGIMTGAVKGLSRIWKFLISGERLAPCVVGVSAIYETEDETVSESWSFIPAALDPFENQFEPKQEEMTELNLTIFDADPTPDATPLTDTPSMAIEMITITAGIDRGIARIPAGRVRLST